MTRSEPERVATLLAGRVAEEVIFNEVSTGAQNDLERATAIVRQMIMEYGMSETLGPITLGRKHDQVFLGRDLGRDRDFSEEIAKSIDQEIRRTVDRCYRMAEELIIQNKEKLNLIAEALLEKEHWTQRRSPLLWRKSLAEIEEEGNWKKIEPKPKNPRRKKKEIANKVKVIFSLIKAKSAGNQEKKYNATTYNGDSSCDSKNRPRCAMWHLK